MKGDSQGGQGRKEWAQDEIYYHCGLFVEKHNRFPTDKEFGQDIDSPGRDPSLPTLDFVERYFPDAMRIVLIAEAYELAGKKPPGDVGLDDEGDTLERMPEPPADVIADTLHGYVPPTSPLMAAIVQSTQPGIPVSGAGSTPIFGADSTEDSIARMIPTRPEPTREPEPLLPIRIEVTEPYIIMRGPGESDAEFAVRKAAAASIPGSRVIEPEVVPPDGARTTRHQTLQGPFTAPEEPAAEEGHQRTIRGIPPPFGGSEAQPATEPAPERPTTELTDEQVRALAAASREEEPTTVRSIDEIVADEKARVAAEQGPAAEPVRPRIGTMPLFSPADSAPAEPKGAAADEPATSRLRTLPLSVPSSALTPAAAGTPAYAAEEPPTRVIRRDSVAPDRVIMGLGVLADMAKGTKLKLGPDAGIGLAETQQATAYAPATPPAPEATARPKTLQYIPPPQPHTAAEAMAALRAAQPPAPESRFDDAEFPEDVSGRDEETRPVTPYRPAAPKPAAAPVPAKAAEPIRASEVAALGATARPAAGIMAQYVITPTKEDAAAKPGYRVAAPLPPRAEPSPAPIVSSPSEIFQRQLAEEQKGGDETYEPKHGKMKGYLAAAGVFLAVGALAAASYLWLSGKDNANTNTQQDTTARVAIVERDAGTVPRDAVTTIDSLASELSSDIVMSIQEEEDVVEAPALLPEPIVPVPPVPPVPVQPPVTPNPVMNFDEPTPEQPPVAVTPIPPTQPEQPLPAPVPDKEGCKLRVNMQFDSTAYTELNATQDIAKYVREMVAVGQTRFYVAGFASIETRTETENDDAPHNVRLATRRAEQVKRDILRVARSLGADVEVTSTTYGETEAFGVGVDPEDRTVVIATEQIGDPDQSAVAAAKIHGPAGETYGCDDAAQTGRTASLEERADDGQRTASNTNFAPNPSNMPRSNVSSQTQGYDGSAISGGQPENNLPKVMIAPGLGAKTGAGLPNVIIDLSAGGETAPEYTGIQCAAIAELYAMHKFGGVSWQDFRSKLAPYGIKTITPERAEEIYFDSAAQREEAESQQGPATPRNPEEQPKARQMFAGIDQTDVNDALDQILLMESTPRNPKQAKTDQQKAYTPDPEELTKLVYSLANEGFESTDIMRVAAIRGHRIGLNDINRLLERGLIDTLGAKSEVLQALDAIDAAESKSREYDLPVLVDETVAEGEIPVYVGPTAPAEQPVTVTRHVNLLDSADAAESYAALPSVTVTRHIDLSDAGDAAERYSSLPPVTVTRHIDLSDAGDAVERYTASEPAVTITRCINLSEPEQPTRQYVPAAALPPVTVTRSIMLDEPPRPQPAASLLAKQCHNDELVGWDDIMAEIDEPEQPYKEFRKAA